MIRERYQRRRGNRIDNEHRDQYSPEVIKVLKPGNLIFTALHMYNDENNAHFKHFVGLIILEIMGDKFVAKLCNSDSYDIQNNTCDSSIDTRTFHVPKRSVFSIPIDAPENANIHHLLNFYVDLYDDQSDSEDEYDDEYDDDDYDDEDDEDDTIPGHAHLRT